MAIEDITKDLVTVALPVRNNESTVANSIKSILYQTHKNWELIIIDDASTDDSVKIIERFKDKRIRFFKHKRNRHIARTLNEIIDMACGKYFARIDGDDFCYPERLEIQLKFLKGNPNVDLVGAGMIVVDKNKRVAGKRLPPLTHSRICRHAYSGIHVAHPTFFGKTLVFKNNKYNHIPVNAQDQDLLFRLQNNTVFANVNQILVCYQENLKIKKIIIARKDLVVSRYLSKGVTLNLLGLIFIQTIKVIIDIFALTTGLNYKIFRQRAMPISRDDLARLQEVRSLLKEH